MFDEILDKDEKIIDTIKPDKARLLWGSFVSSLLVFAFILIFSCIAIFMPNVDGNASSPLWLLVPLGVYVLYIGLAFLFLTLWYRKTYYACTNKRIIIRTGVIGVDFKALDLQMIGAINVNVSWIDKVVGRNTGSLTFGSMSSPINAPANAQGYAFAYVRKPYEIYKNLKEIIEQSKQNAEKQN